MKSLRKILGIDPGTATTGYAIIKTDKKNVKIEEYGIIKTSAKKKMPDRLVEISQNLDKIIKKHKPKEAAVEQLFFAKNVKTGITVGQARGAILLTLAKNSVKIAEYTPLQVKQAITGYGNASKHQVKQMVKIISGIKKINSTDDATDAIAIAICHGNWRTQ